MPAPQPPAADTRSTESGELLGARNPPRPPFESTRDTRFYFPSAGHAEALSRLVYLVQERNMGIGLLTGEIGAGKTLLRTLLHGELADDGHLRVNIENSLLDFDGLLLEILSQMRGERLHATDFPDRYARLAELKRLLARQAASDRHLVVLIDEAQQLDVPALEGLKALTNISSERQGLLTLILIGQPELRGRLRSLPQVDQRISLRFHLTALDRAETAGYLMHRLEAAGYRGEPPISPGALDLLHRASRGIPREINRLAKLALEHTLNRGLGRLTEASVALVVEDLRRHGVIGDLAEASPGGTPGAEPGSGL